MSRSSLAVLGAVLAVGLPACGGGPGRQDKDEPRGNYEVEVVRTDFPSNQKLAKRSRMEIEVRNAGKEKIPNIAVTVNSFGIRRNDKRLGDPRRPVFVVNRIPRGSTTAYNDTYALGDLAPGQTALFRWSVTAVEARPFKIEWTVAAGLDGKAKAVLAGGGVPKGTFSGEITNEAPQAGVADDERTVVEEDVPSDSSPQDPTP